MSAETNKNMVRRLVDEAQVQGKLDVVDELLAEDFVDHTPFPGVPGTREGVKTLFAYLRAAFPDLGIRIDEQIAQDEKVMTRKTFTGTHRGEFMGVPGTGRPIAFEVIDILTVRDGKLAEHRVILDRMSIQEQLTA